MQCDMLCGPLVVYPSCNCMLSPQKPRDVCVYAGFCSAMKKSTPMLKLQPAMTFPAFKLDPAVNSVPAAKLFPATKVESAKDKSSPV